MKYVLILYYLILYNKFIKIIRLMFIGTSLVQLLMNEKNEACYLNSQSKIFTFLFNYDFRKVYSL